VYPTLCKFTFSKMNEITGCIEIRKIRMLLYFHRTIWSQEKTCSQYSLNILWQTDPTFTIKGRNMPKPIFRQLHLSWEITYKMIQLPRRKLHIRMDSPGSCTVAALGKIIPSRSNPYWKENRITSNDEIVWALQSIFTS
jgi:hypothetical protein